MDSSIPKEFSFSRNGQTVRAVLVDVPPAASWSLGKICFFCREPLGDLPFYTLDPLLHYIHVGCACQKIAATAAPTNPPDTQSRHLSGDKSYPYFPNHPFNYQPQPIPHYNQHLYPNYPPQYPYNYYWGYPPLPPPPPPPPSSSFTAGLSAVTVVGPLLQALFSTLFSSVFSTD